MTRSASAMAHRPERPARTITRSEPMDSRARRTNRSPFVRWVSLEAKCGPAAMAARYSTRPMAENIGARFHSLQIPTSRPGAIVSIHFDDPQHGIVASDSRHSLGNNRWWSHLDDPVSATERPVELRPIATPLTALVTLAVAAYLFQASVAIATGRHLFGDGSWLLLRLLSENHITHLNNNTWNDFFVGRLGAFSTSNFPRCWRRAWAFVALPVLSVIFGVTLFSFKPLSLLLCYRLCPRQTICAFPAAFAIRRDDEQRRLSDF